MLTLKRSLLLCPCKPRLAELNRLGQELKLQLSEEAKASCRLSRRQILNHLESHDVTSLEDSGLSILLATRDFFDILIKTVVENASAASDQEEAVPQQVVLERLLLDQSGTVGISKQRSSNSITSERESLQLRESTMYPVYRQEFRIIGQIGEVGQKDKLKFTCLERQIEHGLKKDMMKER